MLACRGKERVYNLCIAQPAVELRVMLRRVDALGDWAVGPSATAVV